MKKIKEMSGYMDSYIFESPIGLLKICEKDGKLTNLYLLQKSTEFFREYPQKCFLG